MSARRVRGAAGSCRECPVTCDRLIFPAGCVEANCDRLYAYEQDGRTIVGCLEKVFGAEIDLELLKQAEAATAGFGALLATREPLPVCRAAVDRTFAHRDEGCCSNPEFLESAPAFALGARSGVVAREG